MTAETPAVVVITGPESSGKSTLAAQLAADRKTIWVAEAARGYLHPGAHGYERHDLLAIGRRQFSAEMRQRAVSPLTIVDTDAHVLELWWRERFGAPDATCQSFLDRWLGQGSRFYLLCQPDLPWEPDPLRENPNDRERLYHWHLERLRAQARTTGSAEDVLFGIVRGHGADRITLARSLLLRRLSRSQPA